MSTKLSAFAVVCVVLAGVVAAQNADFGDLQDPGFPTLRNSTSSNFPNRVGPYHVNVSGEWIGLIPSTTTTEPDARLVDLDEDDGMSTFSIQNVYENAIFQQVGIVRVAVTTSSEHIVRYLNIAADLNNDGVFASFVDGSTGFLQYEWLACNVPIIHVDETKEVVQRFVLLTALAAMPCARVTLTTEPIAPIIFGTAGWDGSGPMGGFVRGETEDYCPTSSHLSDYVDERGGVNIPPIFFPPPNPPVWPPIIPKGPVADPPGIGGGKQWPVPETPTWDPPVISPPETGPVRIDDQGGTPLPPSNVPSIKGMPDIKQSKNGCVPAATANSLRYLMNKAQATPPGDDDEINRELERKLREAMETTPENGTSYSPDGKNPKCFEKGKKKVLSETPGLEGVVTKVIGNPSIDQICAAVAAGKNVEIMIYENTWQDLPPPPENNGKWNKAEMGHLVTVVGCVRYPDGRVELLYHNPADIQNEAVGDSVKPPRVNSIFVENKQKDTVHGGVEFVGSPDGSEKKGRKYTVDMAWIEDLANEAPESAGAIVTNTVSPQPGEPVELVAPTPPGKNDVTYMYQWILNGEMITGASDPMYVIPSFGLVDEGTYRCWIYDDIQTYWFTDSLVLLQSGPPSQVPVGTLAVGVIALGMILVGFRRIVKK